MSSCRIVKVGAVTAVFNEDGTRSELFQNALVYYNGDTAKAMDVWNIFNSEEFEATGIKYPTVEQVLSFASNFPQTFEETKTLNGREVMSVVEMAENTGFSSLVDFRDKLNSIFKPNGYFKLNLKEAVSSGLYTIDEAESINPNELFEALNRLDKHIDAYGDVEILNPSYSGVKNTTRPKNMFGSHPSVTETEVVQFVLDNGIDALVDSQYSFVSQNISDGILGAVKAKNQQNAKFQFKLTPENISERFNKAGLKNRVSVISSKEFSSRFKESDVAFDNGVVFLNEDSLNKDISAKELNYLYARILKEINKPLYERGLSLLNEKNNKEGENALTEAIGKQGANIKDAEIRSNFYKYLANVWSSVRDVLGLSAYGNSQIQRMSLKEYVNAMAIDDTTVGLKLNKENLKNAIDEFSNKIPNNTREAKKLAEALLDSIGVEYSFIGDSDANGVSVYFKINDRKVRFSDHSVTNTDRMSSETMFFFGKNDRTNNQAVLRLRYDLGDPNIEYGKFKENEYVSSNGKLLMPYGFREKKAPIRDESVTFTTPKDVVSVVIDKLKESIHEYGHLYNKMLKENNPELYYRGIELINNELKEDVSVNEFSDVMLKKHNGLETLSLSKNKNTLYIDMIKVDKKSRSKGIGSNVIKDIIEYADKNNLDLVLTPEKIEGETTSVQRLVKFYKGLGFTESKGKNIDYVIGGGKMYKHPNNNKKTSKIQSVIDYVKRTQPSLKGEALSEEILTQLVLEDAEFAQSTNENATITLDFEDSKTTDDIARETKRDGSNDGVEFKNVVDSKTNTDIVSNTYVIFNSNQVKSSVDNTGVFFTESNDIRFQVSYSTVDNGRGVSHVFTTDGENVASIRTLPIDGGEVIEGAIVKEAYRGQGIGTELYLETIRNLMVNKKVLRSDKSQTKYAKKIWDNLVDLGLAVKINDKQYESVPAPFNVTSKTSIDEVIDFLSKPKTQMYVFENVTKDVSQRAESDKFGANIEAEVNSYKQVPTLMLDGDTFTTENIYPYIELKNTIIPSKNITFNVDAKLLLNLDNDVWLSSGDKVKSVLKGIERTLVSNNIDVIGLSELSSNRAVVTEFLETIGNVLNLPNDSNIRTLSNLKSQYLNSDMKVFTRELPSIYDGLSIFNVESNLSENELFENNGLIKVWSDNMYQKVERLPIEELYDEMYNRVLKGEMILPNNFLPTNIDVHDVVNESKIREALQNFVRSRDIGFNSTHQEEISAYQVLFSHLAVPKKLPNIESLKTNAEYLKTRFVTDFYNFILQEKFHNTDLYNSTLKYFKVTDSDISFHGIDLSQIEGMEYEQELRDYAQIKKDSGKLGELLNNMDAELNEDLIVLNNPDTVVSTPYYSKIDSNLHVTEQSSDTYIRTDSGIARLVLQSLGNNIYQTVNVIKDNNIYYDTNLDFDVNTDAISNKFISWKTKNNTDLKGIDSEQLIKNIKNPNNITEATLQQANNFGLVINPTSKEVRDKYDSCGM